MSVSSTVVSCRANKITSLIDIPEDRICNFSESSSTSQCDDDTSAVSEHDASVTSICYKLINNERQNYGLNSLARSETLHRRARLHANYMASAEVVMHSASDLAQLRKILQCPVAGENVQRGKSPYGMHIFTMEKLHANRDNLLDSRFREYGVAAARGSDGKLYLCQLFR